MKEKSPKQKSQELNPISPQKTPENNLDVKIISDKNQQIDLAEASDVELPSIPIKKEEISNKKPDEEEKLEATRYNSVSDLNAELSKLSSNNIEGEIKEILPKIETNQANIKIGTYQRTKPQEVIPKIPNTSEKISIKKDSFGLPKKVSPGNIQEKPLNPTQNIEEISSNPTEKENFIPEKINEKNTNTPLPTKKPLPKTPNNSTNSAIKKQKKHSLIRTYQGDLVNVVKTKNISMAKAIMLEKEAENKENDKKTFTIKKSTQKKIYLSIMSILLILSGVAFIFFTNYYKPTPIIKVANMEIPLFIDTEYQKEINLEKANVVKLTSLIQTELLKTNIPLGSILNLYLTDRYSKENNLTGKKILNVTELFHLLNSRASKTFLRFIEPDFMYGYYSSLNMSPFLILKTKSFDNTFPEMLAWENNLMEDLRPIFVEDNPAISASDLRVKEFEFKDLVIKNKDTRAVLNDVGEVVFIYSFVDKNTLVITTNKDVLQEISTRLILKTQKR